jgi:hypothetical protein
MSLFVMTVVDTFHLEDGRTVFVGPIETEAKIVPPCDSEILVGNEIKASLRIDGEEIPKGKNTSNRSISTSQRINLASYGIGRGGFTMKGERKHSY